MTYIVNIDVITSWYQKDTETENLSIIINAESKSEVWDKLSKLINQDIKYHKHVHYDVNYCEPLINNQQTNERYI